MKSDLKLALTQLANGDLLRLGDSRDKGIAVFSGVAWVTQDSDLRDHVLSAGQSFTFDQPGRVLVQALSSTSVLVFDVDPTRASADTARSAPTPPAAAHVHAWPRSTLEWQLEVRRQRAYAIGSAIARGFSAVRRLFAQRPVN